jgi:hypothetical protein
VGAPGRRDDSSVDEELAGPFADTRYYAVFKRIFTDREVLLGFLNAVEVAGKGVSIEEIGVVEQSEPAEGVRSIVFDIHCKLTNNVSIIIQLHRAMQREEILDRMVGYASRAYAGQWQKGEKSYLLQPVHAVAILYFKLAAEGGDCGSLLQGYSLECCLGEPVRKVAERGRDLHRYYFVQLPLAPQHLTADASEVDKWAYLLGQSGTLREAPVALTKGPLRR